ncbi:unnamed protein product [Fraxinus pennsylvanica]|uniref:ABC1 atypical kinase-like domain-containing protein n=1 Tax=Fraxinus pennsylvanica TaxID=56036 RepID=A0AAD2A8I5_9LAMI|nr:unnamed protein product [Fraxinus pennsylvanica]
MRDESLQNLQEISKKSIDYKLLCTDFLIRVFALIGDVQVPFTLNQRILTCVWIEFFASVFGIFIAVIVMERDALPTFPDEEALTCIERELGLPLDYVYSSISASPIAAASLGQVYRAQLKYSASLLL